MMPPKNETAPSCTAEPVSTKTSQFRPICWPHWPNPVATVLNHSSR